MEATIEKILSLKIESSFGAPDKPASTLLELEKQGGDFFIICKFEEEERKKINRRNGTKFLKALSKSNFSILFDKEESQEDGLFYELSIKKGTAKLQINWYRSTPNGWSILDDIVKFFNSNIDIKLNTGY